MLNIVKRGALRIVKASGKTLDKGVSIVGWGILTLGLYGVILHRAFRSDKFEEDQQEGSDE